jgi:hypothetical protein
MSKSWLDPFSIPIEHDGAILPARRKLRIRTGLTAVDNPTNDSTDLEDTGGAAGGATHVADMAALRAEVSAELVQGSVFYVGSDPVPWVWDATSGAGLTPDHETFEKPDDLSLGSNGRFYRASSAPVLATIAALRLAIAGRHNSIHVQAYATLGDGGGGIFDDVTGVLSTADDGGIFIHAGARVFKRRNSGTIDIREYGILPNDTSLAATNTSRFNALMALFAGGSNAPHIRVPRGIYYFENGTSLDIHDIVGLHLVGDSNGGTIFQFRTARTDAYTAKPFISLVGSFDCTIEKLYFYCLPFGTTGGIDGNGASPCDYVLKLSSHDQSGGDHGGCSRNRFIDCSFQGGAIHGVLIGNDVDGLGSDTNLDQNSFWRCRFNANDGTGICVSSANTSFTLFDHCGFESNGSYHVDIKGFPRTTVFRHCASSNPGMLDTDPHRKNTGYAYHVWRTFGPEALVIEDETHEFGYGLLKTDGSSGGVEPVGTIILRNIVCTNNNDPSWAFKPIDVRSGSAMFLENCVFAGTGAEGEYSFVAAGGVAGPRTFDARNVQLILGAMLTLTNFTWDGAGVTTFGTPPYSNPSPSPIQIKDVNIVGPISGPKIAPQFGSTQDITGHDLTLARSALVRGHLEADGTEGDRVQFSATAHSTQTGAVGEIRNSSSTPVIQMLKDGTLRAIANGVPFTAIPWPGSPGSHTGLYIGIPAGSEGDNNYCLLSNGTTLIVNAPDATSELNFSCGFNQVLSVQYNTGSPFVRFSSTATDPKINVADNTSAGATGNTLHIRGSNATGTGTTTGGKVSIEGGSGTNKGPVELTCDTTVRIKCDATGIGFFSAAPVAKPTVTGTLVDLTATGALKSLLTALANLGLITDSST